MENLKGKGVQELALGQEPTDWFESPSSLTLEVVRDIIELRNCLSAKAINISLHFLHDFVALVASIFFEELPESWVAILPDPNLVTCVLDPWDGSISNIIAESNIRYEFPPGLVNWIPELRMVELSNLILPEYLFPNMVKVLDPGGEPWNFNRSYLSHFVCNNVELRNRFLDIFVLKRSLNINEKVNCSPIVVENF